MKKILSVALCALMIFGLVACSGNEPSRNESSTPSTTDSQSGNQETSSEPLEQLTRGKNLVVFFSMPDNVDDSTVVVDGETLGNTQYMAYVIQQNTNADIFRIEPATPYPTDHKTLVDLAKEEQNNDSRPAIKDSIKNFDSYDTVFIGYPIWWSDLPMIMYTFFDIYDFSGKTIVPFSTHGGSSFAGTPEVIAKLEPKATVADGKTISRDVIQDAEQDIIDWLKDAGYTSSQTDQPTGGKSLVVYYSASGNTKAVAEMITDATGADTFELIPAEVYTSEDLDWTNNDSRVTREHNDESLRDIPLIETTVSNWGEYDTVYIGYPIWWGIAAWPINGFISSNNFTGKTVIPFCTSASSGLGESDKLLAEAAGTGNWLEGHRFSTRPSEEDVRSWIDSLNFNQER